MKTLTNSQHIAETLNVHLQKALDLQQGDNIVIQVTNSRILQDSRLIRRFDVFVALAGHDLNGIDFIESAIKNGASAVVIDEACFVEQESENNIPDKDGIPNNTKRDLVEQLQKAHPEVIFICVPELRAQLADLCKSFYFPVGQPMPIIGITGTNGKTSISHLLAQIAELSLDKPIFKQASSTNHEQNQDSNQQHGSVGSCAVIGTMGTGHYQSMVPSNNTTPGITDVYRLLSEFEQDPNHTFKAVAMEVSSHALAQGRVDGLSFETAVFTNLTHEHLDYHGTMDAYFNEKAKLFIKHRPNNSVINIDDEYGLKLVDILPQEQRIIAVGETKKTLGFEEYVWIKQIDCHAYGLQVELDWQIGGSHECTTLNLPLYGAFNAANIAAVFATAVVSGWSFDSQKFTELTPVPGRLELFVEPNKPIAIVDYAHTPDALEASLKAAKQHLSGRLILVFGCGGDRDTSKRPLMAKVAEKYANSVIVTNDNPRTESQEQIVSDIMAGFETPAQHQVEYDRKEAIQLALQQAEEGDAVLIAGKGHEAYQIIGKQVFDYDERAFVAGLLSSAQEGIL